MAEGKSEDQILISGRRLRATDCGAWLFRRRHASARLQASRTFVRYCGDRSTGPTCRWRDL